MARKSKEDRANVNEEPLDEENSRLAPKFLLCFWWVQSECVCKLVHNRTTEEVKKKLWGGEFCGEGYFVNTVGQHGSEKVIAEYVKRQGQVSHYRQLYTRDRWN